MACPLYDELRSPLIETVTSQLQGQNNAIRSARSRWVGGTQATRFDIIMGLPNREVIKALAVFLQQAFKLKAEYLASVVKLDVSLALPGGKGRQVGGERVGNRLYTVDSCSDSDSEEVEVFVRIDSDDEDVILEP